MVMRIYKNANLNKKHRNGVIAIGNFDGLHLGHLKVINQAKQKAKKSNIPFGVMTFEPVPVMFFKKKTKDHRINSFQQKKEQLKKLKLDFLIIIKFNKKFSRLTAQQFIETIINKKTKCKYLYVSRNFKFGYKRQGNIKTLKNLKKNLIIRILLQILIKKIKKLFHPLSLEIKLELEKLRS